MTIITAADAQRALEAAVGGPLALAELDDAVVSYLVSALVDGDAVEDDVVEVIEPFLPEITSSIAAEDSRNIARALRRELHGAPVDDDARQKPVRLAKATRLGAGIGFDRPTRRKGTKAKAGGNANQALDRTAEAENAKEMTAMRRARRVGKQPKVYASQATVSSVKHTYVAGSTDVYMEGVDLAFGGISLLDNASLKVPYGRKLGVIGSNGAGKTTLMRAMARRELPIPEALDIVYVEQELSGTDRTPLQCVLDSDTVRQALILEERELAEQMTEGDADPDVALTNRLTEVYKLLSDMESDSAEARAASILDGLGFSTHQMTKMLTTEFSGGWRMRISIASALFLAPKLLLLDEPTNHLDMSSVLWLANHLTTWPHTIILVSHDRDFLNTVCTDIVLVKDKTLHAYSGNYDDYERVRIERQKELERAAESFEMKRAHVQKFVDKFRYNAKRAQMAQSRIKLLARMEEDRVEVPDEGEEFAFTFPEPGALTGSHGAVQICNVDFKYPGSSLFLFRNLEFNVNMQSRICLLGPNGTGKSTIMKLLIGENLPTNGEVRRSQKLRIGYFSQHHVDQLVLWRTPLEHMKVTFPDAIMPDLRGHLSKLGVKQEQALRPINTLSGGQKSRVALAVITYSKPHMLMLDEVTNHLDIESVDAIIAAINEFQGGVMLITHDARAIEACCQEIWICENESVTKFNGDFKCYKDMMMKQLAVKVQTQRMVAR
jgi:ATP-binding cassette, subfamily F, member 3